MRIDSIAAAARNPGVLWHGEISSRALGSHTALRNFMNTGIDPELIRIGRKKKMALLQPGSYALSENEFSISGRRYLIRERDPALLKESGKALRFISAIYPFEYISSLYPVSSSEPVGGCGKYQAEYRGAICEINISPEEIEIGSSRQIRHNPPVQRGRKRSRK